MKSIKTPRFTPAIAATLLAATSLLAGCDAKLALAPFDKISATPLQEFQLAAGEEQNLFNNKMFFYPTGMTKDTFAGIKKAARKYDELEGKAFPLYRQQQALDTQILPLRDIKTTAETRIRSLNRSITSTQAKIDAEMAKAEADRDSALLATLSTQKANFEAQKEAKLAEKTQAETTLAPLEAEHARIEAERAPINAEADAALETLKTSVEWIKTPPTGITLKALESGKMSLSLAGWVEEESTAVDRRFSSEEDTIQNLAYRAQSGRLTFDVLVYPSDTDHSQLLRIYTFDVRRTRYDATESASDGRLYYTGDLILKDATGNELRRGVAKFVSTSN